MRIKSLLTLVLACSLFQGQARADAALDRIKARGQLLVSVKNEGERRKSAHKDPAHFAKRDFELGIARAIAARLLGSPEAVEFKLMQKPLRLPAVVSGEVDIAISMFKVTPEAQKQVDFSVPYFESALAALTREGDVVETLAALNGKRIALIERNDQVAGELPAGVTPASVRGFGRFERAAEALAEGEVDALLSEQANIKAFIADGNAGLRCSPPLVRAPVAVVLPKGNPDLQREVNAVITQLKDSGELGRMAAAANLKTE